MNFFIPFADDAAQAERVISATSEFTKHPIPSPRIYSIEYEHNGKRTKATVGENPDSYYCEEGPIICILGDDRLLAICTPSRGVTKGSAIFVGRHAVLSVKYFEPTQIALTGHDMMILNKDFPY